MKKFKNVILFSILFSLIIPNIALAKEVAKESTKKIEIFDDIKLSDSKILNLLNVPRLGKEVKVTFNEDYTEKLGNIEDITIRKNDSYIIFETKNKIKALKLKETASYILPFTHENINIKESKYFIIFKDSSTEEILSIQEVKDEKFLEIVNENKIFGSKKIKGNLSIESQGTLPIKDLVCSVLTYYIE